MPGGAGGPWRDGGDGNLAFWGSPKAEELRAGEGRRAPNETSGAVVAIAGFQLPALIEDALSKLK